MEPDQLGGQALDSYADALVADRERSRRWPPALGDSAFQFSSIDKHQFISSSRGSLNPMREAHPAWLATVCSCTSVSEDSMQCFLYSDSEPDFFQSADFGEPDASPVLLDYWRCFQAIEPVLLYRCWHSFAPNRQVHSLVVLWSVEKVLVGTMELMMDLILQCGLPACSKCDKRANLPLLGLKARRSNKHQNNCGPEIIQTGHGDIANMCRNCEETCKDGSESRSRWTVLNRTKQ